MLYYGNIGWTTSAFLYLVAVDEDGFLLAGSAPLPWTREADIPGFTSTRNQSLTAPPAEPNR